MLQQNGRIHPGQIQTSEVTRGRPVASPGTDPGERAQHESGTPPACGRGGLEPHSGSVIRGKESQCSAVVDPWNLANPVGLGDVCSYVLGGEGQLASQAEQQRRYGVPGCERRIAYTGPATPLTCHHPAQKARSERLHASGSKTSRPEIRRSLQSRHPTVWSSGELSEAVRSIAAFLPSRIETQRDSTVASFLEIGATGVRDIAEGDARWMKKSASL